MYKKVVVAVNKSAYRALVTFTEEELDFICNFVTEKVEQMRKKEVTISDMHKCGRRCIRTDQSTGSKELQRLP